MIIFPQVLLHTSSNWSYQLMNNSQFNYTAFHVFGLDFDHNFSVSPHVYHKSWHPSPPTFFNFPTPLIMKKYFGLWDTEDMNNIHSGGACFYWPVVRIHSATLGVWSIASRYSNSVQYFPSFQVDGCSVVGSNAEVVARRLSNDHLSSLQIVVARSRNETENKVRKL